MPSLQNRVPEPKDVSFDEDSFWVHLSDGRTIGVPLAWFPRLLDASPAQRKDFFLSPSGIHWDAIDEDISVEGLLMGFADRVRRPADAA